MNTQNIHPFLKKLLNGATVEWKALNEIAEVSGAGVDKKSIETEEKVTLLNYMDVYRNPYLNSKIPTMQVTANDRKIKQCNVLKGDIFITPSSEVKNEIGFSGMAVEDMPNVVYSYHIMRIRLKEYNYTQSMFINYLFRSNTLQNQINKQAKGLTRFGLTKTQWETLQIPIPPLAVQEELVKILDKFTELTAELTARKKQYAYYRDKLLTFADDAVEWKPLGEVVSTITAPAKIKTSDYCKTGQIPIIDQGIEFIAGYTDKNLTPVKADEYVIFGDHSEHIKYVDFSFVQGADGLKILKSKTANTKYVYYALINFYRKEGNYKRHWSSAKETSIPIPPLAEQERIVKILDKFDTLTNSISEGIPREIELRKKQYEYYRDKLLTFPKEVE